MDGTLLNEAGQLPDGFIDLLNRLLTKKYLLRHCKWAILL